MKEVNTSALKTQLLEGSFYLCAHLLWRINFNKLGADVSFGI